MRITFYDDDIEYLSTLAKVQGCTVTKAASDLVAFHKQHAESSQLEEKSSDTRKVYKSTPEASKG